MVASNFGVRVLNSLNRPYGKTPEQIKIDKEILEKRLGLFKFLFIEMRKLGYKRGELTT